MLQIENALAEDSGGYRCQVNTEPARSKHYTLIVERRQEVVLTPLLPKEEAQIEVELVGGQAEGEEKQSRSIVSVSKEEESDSFSFNKVNLEEDLENNTTAPSEHKQDDVVASVPSAAAAAPDLGPPSLLAPILSLFCLVVIVLGLGSLRGLWARCHPQPLPLTPAKTR